MKINIHSNSDDLSELAVWYVDLFILGCPSLFRIFHQTENTSLHYFYDKKVK